MASNVQRTEPEAVTKQAANLPGREVSCRSVAHLFDALGRKGLAPEALTAGVPYTLQHLLDANERIDWPSFRTLMKSAGAIWTDPELIELGRAWARSRWSKPIDAMERFQVPGGRIFQPGLGSAPTPAHLFATCVRSVSREIEPGRLDINLLMMEGYEPARESFVLMAGWLTEWPSVLGVGSGRVQMSEIEGGARYQLQIEPRAAPGGWVRRKLKGLFGLRRAGGGLEEALVLLRTRQLELEQHHAEHLKTEEALRESKERSRVLAESSSEGMLIHEGGIILDVNESVTRNTGYERSELIGKDVMGLFVPAELLDVVRKRVEAPTDEIQQITLTRKNGTRFHAEIEGRDIHYQGRKARVVRVRDLTRYREAEEALRASEERYRLITENARDLISEIAPDGTMLYASPNHLDVLGRGPDEIVGRNVMDRMHPEDREAGLKGLRALLAGRTPADGQPRSTTHRTRHEDGRWLWFESRGRTYQTSSGERRAVIVARNITEQKKGADALKASEERYRLITENARDLIVELDLDGRQQYVSSNSLEILGRDSAEIIGAGLTERVHPEDHELILGAFQDTLEGKIRPSLTYRVRHEDGHWVWLESRGQPFVTPAGERRIAVFARDITEQRQQEDALRASEERYRLITENIPDLMIELDIEGRYLYVSPNHREVLGYELDEFIGKPVFDFVHPEDRERIRSQFGDILADRLPGRMISRGRHKDGRWIWFDSAGGVIRAPCGLTRIVVVARDITGQKQQEDALRASEERYRLITENARDFIGELDSAGNYVYVSPNFREATGLGPEELVGTSAFAQIHPEDRAAVQTVLQSLLEKGGERTVEYRGLHRDGRCLAMESTGRGYRTPSGEQHAVVISRDITERKQAEDALRASEERHRLITENARDLIAELDEEGNYVYLSPNLREVLGLDPQELIGSSGLTPVHPEDQEAVRTALRKALDGYPDAQVAFRARRADGSLIWMEHTGRAYRTPSGERRVVAIGRDITERKRAEDALCASEERHRLITENARDLILEMDAEGTLLYMSPNHLEVMGRDPQEHLGTDALELVHWEDRETVLNAIRDLFGGDASTRIEYRTSHKDGRWFWYESAGRAYRTDSGEHRAVIVSRDITERKHAQDALRSSEERYRTITENIHDLLVEADAEGRLIYVSPNHKEIFGYEVEELLGTTGFDRVPPEYREAARRAFETLKQRELPWTETFTTLAQHRDGSQRWMDVVARAFRAPSGEFRTLIVSRDITERKRTEDALRDSEERYRGITENVRDLITELDIEGRLVYLSPNHKDVVGYTPEELRGNEAFTSVDPEDRDEARAMFRDLLERNVSRRITYRARHRDGRRLWFEVTGSRFETASGETRLVVISRDISERVQAEADRRQLETQLRQSQKLESLGIVAGGIAHDFNNLLTPILGYTGKALSELEPDSPIRRSLEMVRHTAHRAADLTNQLLSYAGESHIVSQPIDLSELVREMEDLIGTVNLRKASLRYQLGTDLPATEADPVQVRQVAMNLISNASEAIGKNPGVVTVQTGVMEANRRYLAGTYLGNEVPEGAYVYLEVSDTGCGMDEETKGKIFDPFFTTKLTGRGLGLAALLGIVRAHRGTLRVSSTPGRGTTFRVLFPALPEAALEQALTAETEEIWLGSGTVLVVDDEQEVREISRWMLESAGFSVLTAENGQEGVDLFRAGAAEIRGVLLDLTMPEKGGREALHEIRALRPEVPILLTSGYGEPDVTEQLTAAPHTDFIHKPYERHQLLGKLQTLLKD